MNVCLRNDEHEIKKRPAMRCMLNIRAEHENKNKNTVLNSINSIIVNNRISVLRTRLTMDQFWLNLYWVHTAQFEKLIATKLDRKPKAYIPERRN